MMISSLVTMRDYPVEIKKAPLFASGAIDSGAAQNE
jgi:hypothetical protein